MFDNQQIEALNAPLPRQLVKDRQGFSYIEGHEAIRAANRIFGFGNWQRNEPEYKLVMNETYDNTDRRTGEVKTMFRVGYTCKLSVTVCSGDRQASVTTWGTGYGEQVTGENVGKAHEGAIKEAETDAMKRAFIALGDQFGLALYDKEQSHVEGASREASKSRDESSEPTPYCNTHRKTMRLNKEQTVWLCGKDESTGKWCTRKRDAVNA